MAFWLNGVIYAALLTLAALAPRAVAPCFHLVFYLSTFRAFLPCLYRLFSHILYYSIIALVWTLPGYRGLLGRRTEEKTGGFQRDFLKFLTGAAGENSQLSFFSFRLSAILLSKAPKNRGQGSRSLGCLTDRTGGERAAAAFICQWQQTVGRVPEGSPGEADGPRIHMPV